MQRGSKHQPQGPYPFLMPGSECDLNERSGCHKQSETPFALAHCRSVANLHHRSLKQQVTEGRAGSTGCPDLLFHQGPAMLCVVLVGGKTVQGTFANRKSL